ncbi:hypothetical protein BDD12DRAFT_899645 [Trichophaea hybrida]|nr:hypothetical protein BDD12DRAFT_899645 [Trichophaea hybrida]
MSTTPSKSRAPKGDENRWQLAEAIALEMRIPAFNSPKKPQVNDTQRPDNRNTSPTTWQKAGLRGPPVDNSRPPPNQWPSASEESQDAHNTIKKPSKKGGVNQSEDANDGKMGEETEMINVRKDKQGLG